MNIGYCTSEYITQFQSKPRNTHIGVLLWRDYGLDDGTIAVRNRNWQRYFQYVFANFNKFIDWKKNLTQVCSNENAPCIPQILTLGSHQPLTFFWTELSCLGLELWHGGSKPHPWWCPMWTPAHIAEVPVGSSTRLAAWEKQRMTYGFGALPPAWEIKINFLPLFLVHSQSCPLQPTWGVNHNWKLFLPASLWL